MVESERLLSEGRNKQAVQEVLWLVETVSTAADPRDLESHEARLFCHLVRDYIRFLLAAHERHGETLN